jgi:hypothetical protein
MNVYDFYFDLKQDNTVISCKTGEDAGPGLENSIWPLCPLG